MFSNHGSDNYGSHTFGVFSAHEDRDRSRAVLPAAEPAGAAARGPESETVGTPATAGLLGVRRDPTGAGRGVTFDITALGGRLRTGPVTHATVTQPSTTE